MKQGEYVLVLDVGTTAIKGFVFNVEGRVISKASRSIKKYFPKPGYVEQKPEEMIVAATSVLKQAIAESGVSKTKIKALSITNQRETTIVWNKKTGKPVYRAIVWEDTRTEKMCAGLKKLVGHTVQGKTGLTIDPYFSASKIAWLLLKYKKIRRAPKQFAFGTVDSWILWNIAEGKPHRTDFTNASRTLLFNIKHKQWDGSLLDLFRIPKELLPIAQPSLSRFGYTKKSALGLRVPIVALCGDQQASFVAAAFLAKEKHTKGVVTKVTCGTGTFLSQSLIGGFAIHDGFFTTLGAAKDAKDSYLLEKKIARSGDEIAPYLNDPKALVRYLLLLSQKIILGMKTLPKKPISLVLDGGITRDNLLREILKKSAGCPVFTREMYDGTALGAALLAIQSLKK